MVAKIHINGTGKEAASIKFNDGGVSKEVSRVLLNDGGVVKEIYTSNLYEGAVTIGTQSVYGITSHGFTSNVSDAFGSITPQWFAPDVRMRMVQSSTVGPYVWVEIDSVVYSKPQLEAIIQGWEKLIIGPHEINLRLPASEVIIKSYDDFYNQGVLRGTLQIKSSAFFNSVHSYLASRIGQNVVIAIK